MFGREVRIIGGVNGTESLDCVNVANVVEGQLYPKSPDPVRLYREIGPVYSMPN